MTILNFGNYGGAHLNTGCSETLADKILDREFSQETDILNVVTLEVESHSELSKHFPKNSLES